ncbi:hypothetical protein OKA06_18915 [Novosphingobium sp. MW5]|nr:hypothetical protein [Novosphingobium sp. MW5]
MALPSPPLALCQGHAAALGSNAGRTAMMARYIRWSAVWGFGAGIILGIAIGVPRSPSRPLSC